MTGIAFAPVRMRVTPRSEFANIVIVASESNAFRDAVKESLANTQWRCVEAKGGADAMAKIDLAVTGGSDTALILDTTLPDLDVQEVATMVERTQPAVEVVTSDHVSIRTPKMRGYELLWRALRYAHEAIARESQPYRPERDFRAELTGDESPLPAMIGASVLMRRMYRLVRLVACRETTVLITGATGTGKELVARAIHTLSPRAEHPFVCVNCSAIPDTLLESELFGYGKGAFTGATQPQIGRIQAAGRGTIFLDEIGELSPLMQAKLLRFLQEGEVQRLGEPEPVRVNVRVVAATNMDLTKASRHYGGGFRQDLYYRLAIFPIEVPELVRRERDALLLAKDFLVKHGLPDAVLSAASERALLEYGWPGNVRELEHAIERAVILAQGEKVIEPYHLGLEKVIEKKGLRQANRVRRLADDPDL
jgi:transcriptional regulator with GAF, ATPase, and Fis domain